jgi:hypothetical protein
MKDTTAPSGPKTKCLSTKLTDIEYAALERAAGGQPLGAWARDALLQAATSAAATPTRVETLVVAEVLALRAILLNLQFAVATGDPITVPRMQQLIDRADAEKVQSAVARLIAVPDTTS